MHTSINRAPEYMKQNLTELQGEMNNSRIIFGTLLSHSQ